MPALSRAETERRLALMARAEAEMRLGVYDWPAGQRPRAERGEDAVSRNELLRVGGYSLNYRRHGQALWADRYYKEQLAGALAEAANPRPQIGSGAEPTSERLYVLARSLLERIEMTLESGEEIPLKTLFSELKRTYDIAMELDRHEQGSLLPERGGTSSRMQKFNSFLAKNIVVMDNLSRAELEETLDVARSERHKQLDDLMLLSKEIKDPNAIDGAAIELIGTDQT